METTTTLGLSILAIASACHVAMVGSVLAARATSRHGAERQAGGRRRISVLKPLAGEDDELLANLESFAHLRHPDFEILFGVASLADPAAPIARELIARHPEIRARLVVTDPSAAVNPKVAQLIGLSLAASGALLVISDSNVRVAADYLDALEGELDADPAAGLVTSLIAGTGERSLGAAIENMQLCAYVAPAVAAATMIAGVPLTIGKSMAIRRDVLDAIGGFEAVGDVLAEDHLLGRLVRAGGFAVRLSGATVENRNVVCGVRRTLERHTRWAKMRRAIAPLGFALEPLTEPLVVGAVLLAVFPSREVLAAYAALLAWKVFSSWAITSLLRRELLPLRYLPLEVIRSALAFFCWLRACATRRIEWRGHIFLLGEGSRIEPAPPTASSLRAR